MTDIEHLIYHNTFLGNANQIGLTEANNNFACNEIYKKVKKV